MYKNTINKVIGLSLCLITAATSINACASSFGRNSSLHLDDSVLMPVKDVYLKSDRVLPHRSLWYAGLDVGVNQVRGETSAHMAYEPGVVRPGVDGNTYFNSVGQSAHYQYEWGGFFGRSFVVTPRVRLSAEIDAQYIPKYEHSFHLKETYLNPDSACYSDSTTVQSTSGGMLMSANLLPTLQLAPHWQLFARMGYVLGHQEINAETTTMTEKKNYFPHLHLSQWVSGFQTGLGLQWKYNESSDHPLALRLEYDYRQPFTRLSVHNSNDVVDDQGHNSHDDFEAQATAETSSQSIMLGLGYYF